MNVKYIAQPNTQLGLILSKLLDCDPSPSRIVFVSAFVGLQTIIRIKQQVSQLRQKGTEIRFVFGIDLGGTSQEVLREVLTWKIDVRIIKHRIPGHTFHPKLYLFEWHNMAEIIIGSNNITEGGFFGNYEGSARICYRLPIDSAEYEAAKLALSPFIAPEGPTAYGLTARFLAALLDRNEIPTEAEARLGRDLRRKNKRKRTEFSGVEPIFGIEDIEPPPPLPADLLERLIRDVRRRKRTTKRKGAKKREKPSSYAQLPIDARISDPLFPAAFYMTLPTLQGVNIPGEGRIPLEAIELAKEFWGWPDEYAREESPRRGQHRVYWNWRPKWRVWSTQAPDTFAVQEVRMYMYENSSDFRFYVRPLVKAGADLGDVVRIRRIAGPDAEYECVLARRGTTEYANWRRYCTQPVRNSTRRFGYA